MTLSESIAALVNYGMETGLTPACEKIYTTNLLLDIFHEDDYEEPSQIPSLSLEEILKELLDEAVRRELIPQVHRWYPCRSGERFLAWILH